MQRKPEEPPKGAAPWMSTFSDLMNLLLCFFVLLFSMSTVNEEKFQKVIASLQSSMSILPAGGASIGEGEMISAGVRQLEFLDSYYNEIANSESDEDTDKTGSNSVLEAYKEEALSESEEMAEKIEDALQQSDMQDAIDVDFNEEYVRLSLSGAILFQSGKAEVISEAEPIIDKVGYLIQDFDNNLIEVEGHTDNVPMTSKTYEDNDVLSMYRALNVANMLREKTDLNPAYIKSSGRGEYAPVADNSTAEGRAKNRRVEIKVYNSYYSNVQ